MFNSHHRPYLVARLRQGSLVANHLPPALVCLEASHHLLQAQAYSGAKLQQVEAAYLVGSQHLARCLVALRQCLEEVSLGQVYLVGDLNNRSLCLEDQLPWAVPIQDQFSAKRLTKAAHLELPVRLAIKGAAMFLEATTRRNNREVSVLLRLLRPFLGVRQHQQVVLGNRRRQFSASSNQP